MALNSHMVWTVHISNSGLRLHLVSCLLVSGWSFCVGRWSQTATQRQSGRVPNILLCLCTGHPGKTLSAHQEPNTQTVKANPLISRPSRWCSWLTLTRGTLKATGSMLVLVSMTPTATSTSRTLHSVLGRKAKPCRQGAVGGGGITETAQVWDGDVCEDV